MALSATAVTALLLAAIVGWVGYASTVRALDGESKGRREAELATFREVFLDAAAVMLIAAAVALLIGRGRADPGERA